MHRRHVLKAAGASLFLLASASTSPSWAQGSSPPKKYRLVVQVSDADPGRWGLALNNIRNVQDDVGAGNVEVELVVYGPGIGMLKFDAPTNSRVTEALKSGAKVLACENTMRNQKLQRSDMHPEIGYVPAGVTHLMKRQSEGFAYIRP